MVEQDDEPFVEFGCFLLLYVEFMDVPVVYPDVTRLHVCFPKEKTR